MSARDGSAPIMPSYLSYFFMLIVQIVLLWYITQEKAMYLMRENARPPHSTLSQDVIDQSEAGDDSN